MSRTATIFFRVAGVSAVVVGLVYIVCLGSGRTYVVDEWQFIASRNSFSWDALVQPHGGHPVMVLALFYITVFRTIGLDHPEIFRFTVLLLHAGVAAMTAGFVWRRHGESAGILAGVFILLSGAGAQSILWGFQIGMVTSILMYLVALWMLVRAERVADLRFAIATAVALLVSVTSTSVGVPAIAGVGAASLLSGQRRRVWWVAIPAGTFFLAWSLRYGDTATHGDVVSVLRWVVNSATGSIGAIFNLGRSWGIVPATVLVGAVVVRLWRRNLGTSGIAHVVFLATFWTMTGLGRGFGNPVSSRYLNVVFPVLLLLASELLRSRPFMQPRTIVALGMVVTVALAAQFPGFRREENLERTYLNGGTWMRGRLATVELLRGQLDPETTLARWLGFGGKQPMNVSEYLAAIDSIGDSPAYPWRSLPSGPVSIRRGADEFLNSSLVVDVVPVSDGRCETRKEQMTPIELAGGESVTVRAPAGTGLIVRRFFTDDWSVLGWRPLGSANVVITVPRDALDVPWQIYFDQPVTALECPVNPSN